MSRKLLLLVILATPLAAAEADLSVALYGPAHPVASGPTNVDLIVTNHGPDRATNIRAAWTLPTIGLAPEPRCKVIVTGLQCEAPALEPGEATRFHAGFFSPSDPYTMSAEVASDLVDPESSNNATSIALDPVSGVDLVATLSINPELSDNRSSLITLTVENRGSESAHLVEAKWKIEGAFTQQGTSCFGAAGETVDGVAICRANELGAGQKVSFNVIGLAGAGGAKVTSTATVTSSQPDLVPEDNRTSAEWTVLAIPKLTARVAAAPDEIADDGTVTITFELANVSTLDADRVVASPHFSLANTLVRTAGADCKQQLTYDLTLVCALPDIPANTKRSFDITLRPAQPVGHIGAQITATWSDPQLHLYLFNATVVTLFHSIDVTTTDDAGPGSLRAAMEAANQGFCIFSDYPCRVTFRIPPPVPASGWFTIAPRSPLPVITGGEVLLDGTMQTRLTGDTNARGPEIEITGVHTAGDGIVFFRAERNNLPRGVRSLAINGFSANGVLVDGELTTQITDNFIGTDPTGDVVIPNGQRGVMFTSGTGEVSRNLVRGNGRSGLFFLKSSYLRILDNRLLGNGASGLFIGPGSYRGYIEGNTIAGNGDFGIAIAAQANNVDIHENSIYDNGGAAIDIGLDGPTAGPSPGHLSRPTVTSARYDPATDETVIGLHVNSGSLYATAVMTLYVFADHSLNRAGLAEAERLVGTATLKGAARDAELRVPGDLRGQYVTALLELFIDFGDGQSYDSSELSEGALVF